MKSFNWRNITYLLPTQPQPILLQRTIAINSKQKIYSFSWINTETNEPPTTSVGNTTSGGATTTSGGAATTSGGGHTTTTSYDGGGGRMESGDKIYTGSVLRIYEIPFQAFVDQQKGTSKNQLDSTILQYPCSASDDSRVPGLNRQIMIQAATVQTSRGKQVVIVLLNGHKTFLFNTDTREWLPPMTVSSEHLTLNQFISMRGPYLFVQYRTGEGPQFAIIDAEKRVVRNPVEIPALPRSHGLTFFVTESTDTLNVIVDRWPRCSREWWSLEISSLLEPTHQQKAVLECTQVPSDSIELHHSDFLPVGNRWLVGAKGWRWKYHDYEENLIPHQINYLDGEEPSGSRSTLTIIDKCTGRVQKIGAFPWCTLDGLATPSYSPGFYIPIKSTELVTLELPAILSYRPDKLILGLWESRLPQDIDQIWTFLSQLGIDDAVVIRILSFMLS